MTIEFYNSNKTLIESFFLSHKEHFTDEFISISVIPAPERLEFQNEDTFKKILEI